MPGPDARDQQVPQVAEDESARADGHRVRRGDEPRAQAAEHDHDGPSPSRRPRALRSPPRGSQDEQGDGVGRSGARTRRAAGGRTGSRASRRTPGAGFPPLSSHPRRTTSIVSRTHMIARRSRGGPAGPSRANPWRRAGAGWTVIGGPPGWPRAAARPPPSQLLGMRWSAAVRAADGRWPPRTRCRRRGPSATSLGMSPTASGAVRIDPAQLGDLEEADPLVDLAGHDLDQDVLRARVGDVQASANTASARASSESESWPVPAGVRPGSSPARRADQVQDVAALHVRIRAHWGVVRRLEPDHGEVVEVARAGRLPR